jgi:hypothetical protein
VVTLNSRRKRAVALKEEIRESDAANLKLQKETVDPTSDYVAGHKNKSGVKSLPNLGFEVFTAANMKNAVFWNVRQCLVKVDVSEELDATRSTETSGFTRPTRRHIPEGGILHFLPNLIISSTMLEAWKLFCLFL